MQPGQEGSVIILISNRVVIDQMSKMPERQIVEHIPVIQMCPWIKNIQIMKYYSVGIKDHFLNAQKISYTIQVTTNHYHNSDKVLVEIQSKTSSYLYCAAILPQRIAHQIIIQIKMEINFCNFQQNLSRRDKKDLYSRPLTALIPTHTRTHTTDEAFNLSFLTKRKENHGYTTRVQTSDKKAYRNIRSASLYQTLYPQLAQERACKLQVINNTCFKKIFLSKGKPFRKDSTVYDVNATLSQHITLHDRTKKQNQLPKYHCKKLKVIKGKPKLGRIHSEVNNQEDAWTKHENVTIIGTKIL